MLRVDSFATIQQPEKVVMSMEGVKGLFTVPSGPFACAASGDIQVSNVSLGRVQVSLRKSTKSNSIDAEELHLKWDTRFHMALIQVVKEWKLFRLQLTSTAGQQDDQHQHRHGNQTNGHFYILIQLTLIIELLFKLLAAGWMLVARGKCSICAVLSPQHSVEFQSYEDFRATWRSLTAASAAVGERGGDDTFNLNVPRCALLFDGHSIVDAEGLAWILAGQDQQLSRERITFDLQVMRPMNFLKS